MTVNQNAGAYVAPGQDVDFNALIESVRKLKPRCVECGVPLQESVTGVRARLNDAGDSEKLCRSCAVSEIGERLVLDLPR